MRHAFAGWIREAAVQLDVFQVPRRRQDELGWLDFLADPPSPTDHLFEFVGIAIELCCFDEEGRWCRDVRVLLSMIMAAESVTSRRVADDQLRKLLELAERGDSEMDAIRFWLAVNFGPNAD
ncbi:MAG: hypothetical protein SFX74_09280 [Fimbriimonadaceae bacterium]|nr:hypothetical protein [Fimbriimonadaceae bacterium]